MHAPPFDLDAVRGHIPILRSHVPLANCSQAPQCDATREAADGFLTSWSTAGMDWERWLATVEAAREAFAALIGARAEDVAVSTSLSHATASVASALDFSGTRNRILVSGAEFPTVAHVWLAQARLGAEVVWVPPRSGEVRLEDYATRIDERTLVVSAAHGCYQTGHRQDVRAIANVAHDRGALLYVDAYQTLGTEPFDAPSSGADFVAAGNLKFLLGIPGIAFLWVRPGLADRLRPTLTGWFGRRTPFAFDAARLDWADGARRLDVGTPPVVEAYVALAGMVWLHDIGLDPIGRWNRHLRACAVEGALARGLRLLGPTDPERRTPTTSIVCEDPPAVESALREAGVLASARGPALRLAPHFFNTVEDVERALDLLIRATGRS